MPISYILQKLDELEKKFDRLDGKRTTDLSDTRADFRRVDARLRLLEQSQSERKNENS